MNISVHTFLQKYLKNKQIAGKNLEVREDDTFIVSYPKSGNTWMRMLVGQLLNPGREIGLGDMEEIIPDIYINSHKQLKALSSPRIIKSHECFDPRYRKIIYIVRDPRSVCVSYYHHVIKFNFFGRDLSFDRYFELFIEGKVDTYGTWGENVSSWVNADLHPSKAFLLLKYEDLLRSPEKELEKVAGFMNISLQGDELEKVIEACSKDKLKAREEKEAWMDYGKEVNMSFFRDAKENEWQEILSEKQSEVIESQYEKTMKKLSYL